MQKAAVELGHSPFVREMNKLKGYPSADTFVNEFGGWNEALKAAGLKVNRIKEYSREELITYLQKAAKELGHTPTGNEINKLKGYPSSTVFADQFGSWNKALEIAGLMINREKFNYSREELITYLKKAATELGHTPTVSEISKLKNYPSRTAFVNQFGSWNKALRAAGLVINQAKIYSKEELIHYLYEATQLFDNTISTKRIKELKEFPSLATFDNQFGGMVLAYIYAFQKINDPHFRKQVFEYITKHYMRGKSNDLDGINKYLSFEILIKLNLKNKNLTGYQIESDSIAAHSKNPTYSLKIDNTLALMKQVLEGDIAEEQFQTNIDRQQWFIKAYKENEEYRAKREANVSKQISEQNPEILLAPYTYLGTIHDDKNHSIAIPHRDGAHTHFVAAPLEQGFTLNQYLMNLEDDPFEIFSKAITVLAKFHKASVAGLETSQPFNPITLSNKVTGGTLIDFINKNVVANLNGWQTAQKDFVTTHHDAHLENFYVTTNGEVKLLDFESVKKGHPYHDLMFILNHESLSQDNQKDLLIKYWNERGKKTTETEAEVQLKQIRKLYAAELGKRFAYHATQYAISIQKAKKCRKDNLSILFERHIKDARISLSEQFKFLSKLKELSQKYNDEFLDLEMELVSLEPTLHIQWNEAQKLFDLHCRVSFEDDKGNLIQFRSGPERQLAVFLKNFIKGFKLEKGKSFEPKINGKLPDFYIEVGNRKIIIEYHPAAIERYEEKNKALGDEVLNANYLTHRQTVFPGYEVVVISDYPLTAQSIYEKLKPLLKGTETISDYEKTFEEAMGQIHDFETEYSPNYGTMATQMTLGTFN